MKFECSAADVVRNISDTGSPHVFPESMNLLDEYL